MDQKDKDKVREAEVKKDHRREQDVKEKLQRGDGEKGDSSFGGGSGDSGLFEFCFPAETRVEMAGGSERPISGVLSGDRVRCWDLKLGRPAEGRVERVLAATVHRLIRLNSCVAASPAHRILTPRGYVRFDEIVVGDQLFQSPTMSLAPVFRVEALSGAIPVFNLVVERFACFFVEGLLVEDQEGEAQWEEPQRAILAGTKSEFEGLVGSTGYRGSARSLDDMEKAIERGAQLTFSRSSA